MNYLKATVLTEDNESTGYLTQTLRIKAAGVVKPAAFLVSANSSCSSEILWLYKTCLDKAAHIIQAVSGVEVEVHQWSDKICEEPFVDVIDQCYFAVLNWLKEAMFSEDFVLQKSIH